MFFVALHVLNSDTLLQNTALEGRCDVTDLLSVHARSFKISGMSASFILTELVT